MLTLALPKLADEFSLAVLVSQNASGLAGTAFVLALVDGSTGLDLTDGELGGIVAWWSILHLPPEVLPVVFAEFHRTLVPGGRGRRHAFWPISPGQNA